MSFLEHLAAAAAANQERTNPAPPPPPEPAAPKTFAVGQPVVHTYTDGAGNQVHQVGVAVDVDQANDQVTVAWYAALSGPIPSGDLEAL